MLLTPHIVRTRTDQESKFLLPIFIGSQHNLGIGGPPPLIAPPQPGVPRRPVAAPAGIPPKPSGRSTSIRNPPFLGLVGSTLGAAGSSARSAR